MREKEKDSLPSMAEFIDIKRNFRNQGRKFFADEY